jgi:hypothetical protein
VIGWLAVLLQGTLTHCIFLVILTSDRLGAPERRHLPLRVLAHHQAVDSFAERL